MKKAIIILFACLIFFGCKKEEDVTADFEIYTNTQISSYKIEYTGDKKFILNNVSPISKPYKGVGSNNIYKYVYYGSITAKGDSGISFLFPGSSQLQVKVSLQGHEYHKMQSYIADTEIVSAWLSL